MPAGVALPHPDKVAKGGEDAHYIRVAPQGGVLALADGVSGHAAPAEPHTGLSCAQARPSPPACRFQDFGIDASLYSRKLLRNVADAALLAAASAAPPTPRELLAAAQDATREPGASTAVLASLDGAARTLRCVNLGDSGYRLLRGGALAAASLPQQHEFDCPYQLGCAKFISNNDTAAMGAETDVALQEGDLLLLASDGLFDNMEEHELVQIATTALAAAPPGADGRGAHAAAQRVAAALAGAAAAHARDPGFDSPYAREAARAAAEARAAAGPLGAFAAALGGKKPADKVPTVRALLRARGRGRVRCEP